MRRIAYSLVAMLFLGACTFNTKGVPSPISALESDMAATGNQFGYSYSAFASSTPLVTMSGSASHVIGAKPLDVEAHGVRLFPSEKNAPTLAFGIFANGCDVPTGVADELRFALDKVFSKVTQGHDWRQIQVRMDLFPTGYGVAEKSYAFRFGRTVALRFYFPCGHGTQNRDTLHAYLTALHELSHVLFHLTELDHREDLRPFSLGQELLAEGLPACIYVEFEEADPLQLARALPRSAYFSRGWRTSNLTLERQAILCPRWVEAMNGKLGPG